MRPRAREMLSSGARDFAGEIPLILKTNDNNVLREEKDFEPGINRQRAGHASPGLLP